MRGAQPAFRHRHRRALLAGLHDLVAVGVEVAKREEQIHVLGLARHVEGRGERPGDLDVLGSGGVSSAIPMPGLMPPPITCDEAAEVEPMVPRLNAG